MATAPAHVEDKLNDAWLEFAVEKPCGASDHTEDEKPADASAGSTGGDVGIQQAPIPLDEPGNIGVKIKKPVKLAMEALIRGFEKYTNDGDDEEDSEVTCDHNIAAWHNVCRPYVSF